MLDPSFVSPSVFLQELTKHFGPLFFSTQRSVDVQSFQNNSGDLRFVGETRCSIKIIKKAYAKILVRLYILPYFWHSARNERLGKPLEPGCILEVTNNARNESFKEFLIERITFKLI
ncbi:hypothetical protein FBX97_5605 [Herbaspirillum sp. SJZ107]|nr:hypothetical protein FBX97_5605 [Herbaspirillum sp. SJZ107]